MHVYWYTVFGYIAHQVVSSNNGDAVGDDPTGAQSNAPITTAEMDKGDETK